MTSERLAEIREHARAATVCPKADGENPKHVWSGSSFTHAECSACRYTRPRGERAEETVELLAEIDRLSKQIKDITHTASHMFPACDEPGTPDSGDHWRGVHHAFLTELVRIIDPLNFATLSHRSGTAPTTEGAEQ